MIKETKEPLTMPLRNICFGGFIDLIKESLKHILLYFKTKSGVFR